VAVVDKSQWPRAGGYIRRELPPLHWTILERAWRDAEIAETPPGSNRGTRIETYLRRASVPESVIDRGRGYWCAAWLGAVWADAGAAVPPGYASCDSWVAWATHEGTWIPKGGAPIEGCAVLYGVPGDASHIGLVTRWDAHYTRALEGNSTSDGFSREGTLVAFKSISMSRVLGYVRPRAA
jgi:hypothetical protein